MPHRQLLLRLAVGNLSGARRGTASSFASLLPADPSAAARLAELAAATNAAGGTYHRLSFGPGITFEGDYDLGRYLPHHDLPEDLAGKSVLDVGTASGFWALECSRRGADVTAIDVHDDALPARIAKLLDRPFAYEKRSVYDLPRTGWSFDLVICGSLLLHLPDPLGALVALRSVCRGRAIVSTASTPYSRFTSRPVCEFRARRAPDGRYFHFWELSAAALVRLLGAAGFRDVRAPRHFFLESEPGRTRYATPHVVTTASV